MSALGLNDRLVKKIIGNYEGKKMQGWSFYKFIVVSGAVLALTSLVACASAFADVSASPKEIQTEPGAFKDARSHVQGICCDENAIYAVFANYVYKLDWSGKVLKGVPADSHSGDPCLANGKLYVSMSCKGEFAVYEYDLELNLLRKIKCENVPACDGIAYWNDQFFTGGSSSAEAHEINPLNIFDKDFNLISHYDINFGAKTFYGPQSIAACRGVVLVAYYTAEKDKNPLRAAIVTPQGEVVATSTLDGSNGWCALPQSMQPDSENFTRLIVARTDVRKEGQTTARFIFFDFDGKTLRDVTDRTERP